MYNIYCNRMFIIIKQITEQLNCFTTATIQYTESLKQAQVILNPNIIAECDFPDEVLLELFINTGTVGIKYVFDNFTVATTEVIMTNIEITEKLVFSYINISSIYGFTVVRVSQFADVASLMNECFDMT